MVLVFGLAIVASGIIFYCYLDKSQELSGSLNSVSTQEKQEDRKENSPTTETDEKTEEQNTPSNSKTEEYKFENQSGEEVTIEASKIVTATGFAGASNYKFYLRGTTLYFQDTSSSDNKEEIIAYNIKDLYLENKEVTAELGANGKIVKENNYITYK